MADTQGAVTRPLNVGDLKNYKEKNPVKFAHKFGEIDFDNLPPNFEAMIPLYKMLVVRERVRREENKLPLDVPAITPWIFEAIAPKAVVEETEVQN